MITAAAICILLKTVTWMNEWIYLMENPQDKKGHKDHLHLLSYSKTYIQVNIGPVTFSRTLYAIKTLVLFHECCSRRN